MSMEHGVTEDKVVSKLEHIGEEVMRLQKELELAKDRIHFLEERISGLHDAVFGEIVLEKPSEQRYYRG